MQTHYSLVYREDERDILPTLKVVFPLPRWCREFLSLTIFPGLAFWSRRHTEVTPLSQPSRLSVEWSRSFEKGVRSLCFGPPYMELRD